MKVGISQLLWGYNLAHADRFVQFLDDASALGYEGVLLFDSTVPFWYNRPGELSGLLRDRGLQLVGCIHGPSLDFRATRRLAQFIAELGGERLILSGRDGRQDDWDVVPPLLNRHGEIAAEQGLRCVYHHHTNWLAETMEQYERLLPMVPALGTMLDCGHATKDFVGHSALEFARKHPEIEYVELKDWSAATDLNTVVGQGTCDFAGIVALLKERNYGGWVVVEQNGPSKDPKGDSGASMRYIRERLEIG